MPATQGIISPETIALKMTSRLKLLLLSVLTVAAIIVLSLLRPIPQDPAYHQFADRRSLGPIPDFANVISNSLFLPVGIWGLFLLRKSKVPAGIFLIYLTLFSGIFFTGLGSAWYHLHPDNRRLVCDRLPMTLVFMALLSAIIGERIGLRLGLGLLGPLIVLGAGSVLWWYCTESKGYGDLRLYVFVQYYPILLIPLILWLFPAKTNDSRTRSFLLAVVWYTVAKLFDVYDRQIYSLLGWISGHTIKHIAAAIATWFLVRMFQQKYLTQNRLANSR